MARSTVYNQITSPDKIEKINRENKELMDDFLDYLESVGRAETTIKNYRADLLIFFCWVFDELDNKSFVKITKREIARFQNHATKVWGWSSNRLRTVKSALSSLGNYIESILDEEYEGFRSIVRKVESPPRQLVREKTVLSEENVDALLKHLTDKGEYEKACFFALAAFSGRRKSELCRFRVSDVFAERLICGGALYKTAPIKTKGRGTNGKQLCCYVLAKKFRPYLEKWMEFRLENNIDSKWLFPKNDDGEQHILTTTVDAWSESLSRVMSLDI